MLQKKLLYEIQFNVDNELEKIIKRIRLARKQ